MSSSRRAARAPVDLSGMTTEELKAVRLRVDALLSVATALVAATAPTREEDTAAEFMSAVLRHIVKRGAEKVPPVHVLRRARWWKSLESGSASVAAYIAKHAPDTAAKRQSRLRAYWIVVGVLIRWLERIHVPVTLQSVAQNLHKVPAVMDQQFPGYASNHLLEWVFKA